VIFASLDIHTVVAVTLHNGPTELAERLVPLLVCIFIVVLMSGTVNNIERGLDENSQTFSCLPFEGFRSRALAQEQYELSSERGA